MLVVGLVTAAVAGLSVNGATLTSVQRGEDDAETTVLVVGGIHGDEPGSRQVARAVADAAPPPGVRYVVVTNANPDGAKARRRTNARGVDLNRNFPHRWRAAARRDRYWPGPGAGSEPETKWLMRLIEKEKPDLSIWLHQPYGFVVDTPGAAARLERTYAFHARMAVRDLPNYRGTVAGWQNARHGDAFVVELPAGRPARAAVERHVRAVRMTAVKARPVRLASPIDYVRAPAKPTIKQTPIRFDTKRKRDMKAYARRHYGINSHLLKDPKVVVQHYTASNSFSSAFNTFAPNVPDGELGELPGVCSHFIIDTDGTIHQLVSLKFMCRHTVGLNYTSVGIEHVGTSDAQVLGNDRQMAASLKLTRWLQHEFGIRTKDVIGHNESLKSPYHLEKVARLRTQTHGDFPTRAMKEYRTRLSKLPKP